MLVKQHTGMGTGSLAHSVLSLQVTSEKPNPVQNFYMGIGFKSDGEDEDNGLSLTSQGFQKAVKDFPMICVWK
jgi:hypothetical protein